MSILKKAYYLASSVWPLGLLKKRGAAAPLLPYHHTVSNDFLPHIKHLYNYKNETQFSTDLDFLLTHFRPISLPDLIRAVQQNGKPPRETFLLTFDDGFREIYDIIAPVLEKKGIPACFFINPAFIDNRVLFYRCKVSLLIHELKKNGENKSLLNRYASILGLQTDAETAVISGLKKINPEQINRLDEIAAQTGYSFDNFLKSNQPFLSTQQLVSLHKRGFAIGAHSLDHPRFQLLSQQEQVSQVTGSCQYVNDLFQTNDCCFSFPHSDQGLPQSLFDVLSGSGIPLLFGIQNQKTELNNKMLHRFNAERPEFDFSAQVKGVLMLQWLRRIINQNQVTRH